MDSRVPKFIFEPCHLLLEYETHLTHYHGHTAEHVSKKKTSHLAQSTIGKRASSMLTTDPVCDVLKECVRSLVLWL